MNEEIVFFYDNQLPEGSPNATRIISLAKAFQLIGLDVILVGLNKRFSTDIQGIYEGVPYELLTFEELKMLGGFNRVRRAEATIKVFSKWLDQRQKKSTTRAIVYSGSSNGLTGRFIALAKQGKIPVIYNWVEWFQKAMFPGFTGWFRYFIYLFEFHFLFPKFRNVIAISSLLDSYAKKKKCNSIRIPTIVDIDDYIVDDPPHNSKLILSYAGKIAKKDLMTNAFSALELLSEEERKNLEYHIYGITEQELINSYNSKKMKWMDYIGKQIICEGQIPYALVRKEIQKADFTMLLRKQWKNANAGFPTKVGESMAAGVPVIANITSDIGSYLHDGVEGIVCKSESSEEFAKALQYALSLSCEKKAVMRVKAREQAEAAFNYRMYTENLSLLLHNLMLVE